MIHRPRRLRTTPAMRALVREGALTPANLIYPMFVREGISEPTPISAMPGQYQHTLESLADAAREAVEAGVGGLMLFGIPAHTDPTGSQATSPDGILNRGLRVLREAVGDRAVIIADLCLDEFTSHGHCGVLDSEGRVDNDATLPIYAEMAVQQAKAGAHMLGLSGMMDGQVAACRAALDAAGHTDVAILSYAAKYASGFYGPFREAVDSQLKGDRRAYQMDPANRAEAMIEVELDLAEGADVVMVKPASHYLDVVADVSAQIAAPVAAYQVSGEYSMLEAAAANGWIQRERLIAESLTSIHRAGARMIATYWAVEAARMLRNSL
ncbi:porphobilinogen synthase [Arcanobacterium wilhelmae]|uniref:Delta-aminolevulinic acid dehydratase n=1 Tax=Arcanobacterium wilhelmae TaxID=1803177 RepID=A0ABT9NCS0_9ACTO|nr:porphobilinogen synthase [Arcanobacterium wilhelmae]MDP9800991.1 porphobilinogen synthase [Arcanobacterium wilhelmae]WFN90351.1 porphobilinogen synthase [Arcanobacterium wilhelmae]